MRFGPPKADVRHNFRHQDLADQRAVAVVAMDAVAGAGPDSPRLVQPETVEQAVRAGREDAASGELSLVVDIEDADVARAVRHMRGAGVDDIETLLVGREGDPVRTHEVVGDDAHVARLRIDAVDVAGADLAARTCGPRSRNRCRRQGR